MSQSRIQGIGLMWKIRKDNAGNLLEGQKRENDTLKNKVSQFQAILDSMVEGVIALDRQAGVIFINPAIEHIFSIKKANAMGKPLLEAIRNSELFELYSQALSLENPVSREINMLLPVERSFQVSAAAVREKGLPWAVVMILNDITKIRRLDAVRKDFIANVSHELKTPLTSIKGFIETLLAGAIDDKENNRKFLEIILGHSHRLERLISELLELSRLESEKIILDLQDLPLSDMIQEVIDILKLQIAEKKIQCEFNIPGNCIITADKARIGQVLNNLLDNAVKFNRKSGQIIIDSEDAPAQIKVIIQDTGCGIPEKEIPRIFERFYRVDKARSRQLGGTGLGLSIVKHIIELHNGQVGVESVQDKGSRFWFVLPKRNFT